MTAPLLWCMVWGSAAAQRSRCFSMASEAPLVRGVSLSGPRLIAMCKKFTLPHLARHGSAEFGATGD